MKQLSLPFGDSAQFAPRVPAPNGDDAPAVFFSRVRYPRMAIPAEAYREDPEDPSVISFSPDPIWPDPAWMWSPEA